MKLLSKQISIVIDFCNLGIRISFLIYSLHDIGIRAPSSSRIRAKMLYATSRDRFRRELDGVHYEIQATDPTEMDLEVIKDRAHWIISAVIEFCSVGKRSDITVPTYELVIPVQNPF